MNKEYLNEEQYQKTKKKLSLIGKILLCLGVSMVICSIVLHVLYLSEPSIIALLGAVGFIMIFLGIGFITTSNRREINAFYVQQQMPVVKETVEKMAPSAGVVAKEMTKGIKEGLKDEEK